MGLTLANHTRPVPVDIASEGAWANRVRTFVHPMRTYGTYADICSHLLVMSVSFQSLSFEKFRLISPGPAPHLRLVSNVEGGRGRPEQQADRSNGAYAYASSAYASPLQTPAGQASPLDQSPQPLL